MSTKKESTSTIQYSPTGMAAYNALIPQSQGVLQDYMQDPFKSTFFNNMFGQATKGANARGAARQQNVLGNLNASGLGGRALPGYAASQMASGARGTSGEQNDAMSSLLNYASQMRMGAAQTGAAFQPLQTGQTTTEKTSGLGTWLPQVIGAGVGGAMNFFAPGLGSMGSGSMSGAGKGIGSTGSGMSNMSKGMGSLFPSTPPSFNAYSFGGGY